MHKPKGSISSLASGSPRKVIYSNPAAETLKLGTQYPSRIPPDTAIVIKSPVQPDVHMYETEYDDKNSCYNVTVFPRKVPDSREDVKYLDKWLTTQLTKATNNSNIPKDYENGVYVDPTVVVALNQIKVLDCGFSEMIRQVTIQCSERGELIHRMWHSSHDLFAVVYADMATHLRASQHAIHDRVSTKTAFV